MTNPVMRRGPGRPRREKGRFAPAAGGSPKPNRTPPSRAYAQYRKAALRLMRHLEEMMPPEKPNPKKGPASEPATSQPALSDTPAVDARAAATAPEYDRLLSKGQGVIEAFETLGLLVIRLIDKERENVAQTDEGAAAPYPKIDEADLDRRYRAALDRICNPRTEA